MVCRPTVMLCVRGGGVSCVSDRAQLGRLGGSRWGWLLQVKFPCHKTHPSLCGQGSLSPPAPDQETVANFQQSLRPSSPACLCPLGPPPSELVQGVAMSTSVLRRTVASATIAAG